MTKKDEILESSRSITVAGVTYNFKEDYTMIDVEKLSTVKDKMDRGEVNSMEVAYSGIFYLLESMSAEDGSEIILNYNQTRETFRSLKATEFNQIAAKMASIKASDDKKKDSDK